MKAAGKWWVLAGAIAGLSGCGTAPTPSPPPLGEVVREGRGEIVAVNDVSIDLSRATRARQPSVPLPIPSPLGIFQVPMKVPTAGTSREMPGEELTVRLLDRNREMITIVQERSSPAMAVGERVRVLYEREDPVSGVGKIRIERE